ncbi:hypothetical protein VOLCADRAFT_85890 [Volvox carteri f. nagariensis]|uniref:CASTOR/POLLUX/SYM8 ion channel conserved domain-containing protein n=1 Tax=Volvox carteri f. nagariensis TaxID=3068 RepID=D8TH97_VOLCA|nr:uncharacterized protein VOLCADRAFT_85890 [Volvox carteri f. nagariensis]EFJ52672.1 hypothetical protein VOLCADRAFT_85890 [Volvox carteri f. nagariensis]|eukprot:XP_002945677.1 hypothetical protein VOLCADRAFT_85890 [Volvox carteri f. nagariensis]
MPRGHPFQQQAEVLRGLLAWVNYKVLQMMTLPAWGKLLTVLFVAVPILAMGSWALRTLTGQNFREALLRCYLILNNVPGADIASETDPRAAVVLNLVYTVGLLTFAALIGVIGDDISNAVEAARLGNSRVVERNHTVVLGHNRQLVEVLRQVALVRADRGAAAFPGQLVVLSERDRGSMEDLLVEALGPAAAAGIVTRQGSPIRVADLQRVSAGHARTVIMLAPEPAGGGDGGEDGGGSVRAAAAAADSGLDPDGWRGGGAGGAAAPDGGEGGEGCTCLGLSLEARQAVTLAALHHLRHQALRGPGGRELGSEPQTVVVQHDADLDLLDPDIFARSWGDGGGAGGGARGSGGGATASRHLVTPVSHLNSFSRIQAQCASQPGLSVVMSSIMQQKPGMPEFYVQHIREVVGLTYGQARRLFPHAVLCGVYDPAAATAFAANSAEARLDAAAKAVVLNPPDSMPLQERYALILLADRTEDCRISHARLAEAQHARQFNHSQQQQHHHHQHQDQDHSQHGKCQQREAVPTDENKTQKGLNNRPPGLTTAATAAASLATLGGGVRKTEHRLWGGGGGGGTRAERGAAPLRVVILVFNGQQPEELLEGVADYCPPGSQAVVVAAKDTPASRGPPSSLMTQRQRRRLRVSTVVGDPRTRGSLRDAGAYEADAVILAGLEGVSTDNADAQALATLIQLQSLPPPLHQASAAAATVAELQSNLASVAASRRPQPPPLNLVCSVIDPRVREIMNSLAHVQIGAGGGGGGGPVRRQITIEAINADELLAGVVTQVAAEPRLSGLFHELSNAEGVEIHLRTPPGLKLPYNQQLTWDQVWLLALKRLCLAEWVQDAGRAHGVTVIGLLHASTSTAGMAAQPRLQLGVPLHPSGAATELQPGDKVVVLSVSWVVALTLVVAVDVERCLTIGAVMLLNLSIHIYDECQAMGHKEDLTRHMLFRKRGCRASVPSVLRHLPDPMKRSFLDLTIPKQNHRGNLKQGFKGERSWERRG